MFLETICNLLRVKSIITLAIVGAMVYLAVKEYISPEAFTGIASSVVTYYFTRKQNDKEEPNGNGGA